MKWQEKSRYERDFKKVEDRFPKLRNDYDSKTRQWIITGDLDICDTAGDYWGTFKIKMFVPQSYPHCVPCVQELSNIIPRHADWHIDDNGLCCLDIEHRLYVLSRKGIVLDQFISEKVYSFFANQLYKLRNEQYAGEEYKHNFDGVVQFYQEDLDLIPELAVTFLGKILDGTIERNILCPCGSKKKVKYCHWPSVQFLKSINTARLIIDHHNFKLLQNFESSKEIPAQ